MAPPDPNTIPLKPLLPKLDPVLPRPKPMEVLVLGMSRTGTMSMYQALTKLGYNTYHAMELGRNSKNGHVKLWNEALDAKYHGIGKPYEGADFDKMLWNYQAVSDIPSILFVDELLAAYPDAKVIVTDRDVHAWARSVSRSFYEILLWPPWRIMTFLDRWTFRPYTKLLTRPLEIWTDGDWKNQEKVIAGFKRHYDHVRTVVPAKNRLEFQLGDGWEPLCEFLGKDIPSELYPYINKGDAAANLHKLLFKIWTTAFVGKVVAVSAVIVVPVLVARALR